MVWVVLGLGSALVVNINNAAEPWSRSARAVIVVIKGVENSNAGSPIFPWIGL